MKEWVLKQKRIVICSLNIFCMNNKYLLFSKPKKIYQKLIRGSSQCLPFLSKNSPQITLSRFRASLRKQSHQKWTPGPGRGAQLVAAPSWCARVSGLIYIRAQARDSQWMCGWVGQQIDFSLSKKNFFFLSEPSYQHIYQHMRDLCACCTVCCLWICPPTPHLCTGSSLPHLIRGITLALIPCCSHYQIFPLYWITPTVIQTFFSIFHLNKPSLGLTSPPGTALLLSSPFQQDSF